MDKIKTAIINTLKKFDARYKGEAKVQCKLHNTMVTNNKGKNHTKILSWCTKK